jgi:hypothetical protein
MMMSVRFGGVFSRVYIRTVWALVAASALLAVLMRRKGRNVWSVRT